MSARPRLMTLVVVCAGVLAACGTNGQDTASRQAQSSLRATAGATPTTTSPSATCDPQATAAFQTMLDTEGYASLRPPSPMPTPGAMPTGSFMADVQSRGKLIVGVDQNTMQFGYRNPATGQLEGFDIDILRAVARAIFGDLPDHDIDQHITFRTVTTDQRIPAVQSGAVDVLASLLTVNCDRDKQVGLSTVYYLAHQGLLVRNDSSIKTRDDLAGKRVCATKGSTTIKNLKAMVPLAKRVPAEARTDCLVYLQEGKVDAVSADDTILRSFEAQDPTTTVLPEQLSNEPYAVAVGKDHRDFLAFVDGVLAQMRADGELASLERTDLGGAPSLPPEPRYAD